MVPSLPILFDTLTSPYFIKKIKTLLTSVFTVCKMDYYLYNNNCYKECPLHTYVVEIDESNRGGFIQSVCVPCHYSCETCNGSNDYQCTSCYPDEILIKRSNGENYCFPNAIRTKINAEVWYFWVCLLLVVILVILISSMILYIIHERRVHQMRKSEFLHLDSLRNIREIEKKVKSAVYSDSDWK